MQRARTKSKLRGIVTGLLVIAYTSSYVIWSRRAIEQARSIGSEGYYFFEPTVPMPSTKEAVVRMIYLPCIIVDVYFFNDPVPSQPPLLDLSAIHAKRPLEISSRAAPM